MAKKPSRSWLDYLDADKNGFNAAVDMIQRAVRGWLWNKAWEGAKPYSETGVDWHNIDRDRANAAHEFDTLDQKTKNSLAAQCLKDSVDAGFETIRSFLGETWRLQPSDRSIFHGPAGDGKDNWKWMSNGGREMVLHKPNPEKPNEAQVDHSEKFRGTYNFGKNDFTHVLWDVLPYLAEGNGPETPPKTIKTNNAK